MSEPLVKKVQPHSTEAERTVLAGQKTSFIAAQELLDSYYAQLKAVSR